MAQTCVAKLLSASLLSHFPLSLSLSLKEFVGCLTRVDTQEEEEERSNMRIK
jgi:hypothetical protein